MDERERRIGLNEAMFREVNERLRGVNEAFGQITRQVELVCECADAACLHRIAMDAAQYEDLRSEPDRFVVSPGHVVPTDVEEVFVTGPGWEIVRKRPGAPADLAAATEPSLRERQPSG